MARTRISRAVPRFSKTPTASGKGAIAEQILAIAFERGIKVRKDAELVEILSLIDVDSPIPLEAFTAVAVGMLIQEGRIALGARLEECIGSANATGEGGARDSKGKTVVLLGCPSPRRGFEAGDGREILAGVVRAANVDACPERSTAFAVGHASFALALARAGEILGAGESGPVFVGAVDTHYDESAVAHFGEQDRILSHRTTSGFLPAEGAAFFALRSGANESTYVTPISFNVGIQFH